MPSPGDNKGKRSGLDLATFLPPPPPPELDDLLDAAERCFARFGLRRTSVPDIAQELGVDRTTVYRRAGNIDQISLMLASRELHRFLHLVAGLDDPSGGPEAVVEALAAVIEGARAHPVAAKLLADERELVGSLVARFSGMFITQTAKVLAPIIEGGVRAGRLAERDPDIVAQWLVRVGVSLVVVDAGRDVREVLREILIPALTPAKTSTARRPPKRKANSR